MGKKIQNKNNNQGEIKEIFLVLICVFFCVLSIPSCGNTNATFSKSTRSSDLTPHAPIYINGSLNFAFQATNEGWHGNGSATRP